MPRSPARQTVRKFLQVAGSTHPPAAGIQDLQPALQLVQTLSSFNDCPPAPGMQAYQ